VIFSHMHKIHFSQIHSLYYSLYLSYPHFKSFQWVSFFILMHSYKRHQSYSPSPIKFSFHLPSYHGFPHSNQFVFYIHFTKYGLFCRNSHRLLRRMSILWLSGGIFCRPKRDIGGIFAS
jgi:hypothetical protein